MELEGHKIITATSAGHGVLHCHRCGWPFPKQHPSSKHRRAHKRVCGTIEGYKIIHSEDHDHYLAFSDDDHHASDDDEHHTPSPNIVKKIAESRDRVGEKSIKSEDDVFSDAAMDFSDSGISPQSEVSVRESVKSSEHKGVEGGGGKLDMEEVAETTEQLNDARSEEIRKPATLSNGNNHPDNVMPIADTASEMVSGGLLKHGLQGETIRGPDADIRVQEHGSASVSLDPEEGKVLDKEIALAAGESQDESCDKFVSQGAKDDSPTPSQIDTSDEVNSVVHSAERSTPIERAEMDETRERIDTSAVNKEASHSTENIGSTATVCENTLPEESLLGPSLVKPNESTKTLDVTEHSDVTCILSSINQEEMPKTILDASDGEKCDVTGGYENQSLECTNLNFVDANSFLGSTDNNAIPCEDNNTTMGKDDCGDNINITTLETGNEKGEGVSGEVEVIPDSTMPSEKPTYFPSSYVADGDAKSLQEINSSSLEINDGGFQNYIKGDGADGSAGSVSEANEKGEGVSGEVEVIPDSTMPSEKPTDFPSSCVADAKSLQENNSSSLEIKDGGFQNSIEGDGADGSAGSVSEANEIGDALDKSSSPNSSLGHPVTPITSELLNNVHVEVEPVDVTETVSKVEDDNAVLVSGEKPQNSISKESTLPLSDSVLLSESIAKYGRSDREDCKPSEYIANAEVTTEDHESVEPREIPECPNPKIPSVQESFPTSTYLSVTSPDVKQMHTSDDLSTLKSVDIISSAQHSFDDKNLKSDECFKSSEAPSVKQPVPSPSDVEDIHGISDTVDDKSVVIVEDVTSVDAKSVDTEVDCKPPTKQTDDASAVDMSSSLTSRSDSLEANCGSVVSDILETNSQKHKTHSSKSDTFEPPSFTTLVQSGSEGAATEIETVQNNQQPKPDDALQAGWFPSLTTVVNESEGRKKNEEIIAKVTNWSPVKPQHSPLKSLLNEVKSPNTKEQVPVAANQKVELAETKDDNVGSETHTTKDQDSNKHVEEWNSPARYPIEIKKEKKKGRPFWVPFVCCSSAHRDL